MKNYPPEILAALEKTSQTIYFCWKITTQSGLVKRLTESETNLIIDNEVYVGNGSTQRSGITLERDLFHDRIDIAGIMLLDGLTRDELVSGVYNKADVEMFGVFAPSSGVEGKLPLLFGIVGNIEVNDNFYRIEVNSLTILIDKNVGVVYTDNCRARLGDLRCKVPSNLIESQGIIATYSGDSFTITGGAVDPMFKLGTVKITSGPSAGEIKRIKSLTGNSINLYNAFTFGLNPGDTCVLTKGCNGSKSTCINSYGNYLNFRGEPDIPDVSSSVDYKLVSTVRTHKSGTGRNKYRETLVAKFGPTDKMYGSNIPIVIGEMEISCPVLWADDITQTKDRKGGSNIQGEVYPANFMVGICLTNQGLIKPISTMSCLRVSFNEDVLFNVPSNFNASFAMTRMIDGFEGQNHSYGVHYRQGLDTDGHLNNTVTNNTPAYNGIATINFTGIDLWKYNGQIPNVRVRVRDTLGATTLVELQRLIPLLCELCGVPSNRVRVEGIADTINGIILNAANIKDTFKILLALHGIECYSSVNGLVFKKPSLNVRARIYANELLEGTEFPIKLRNAESVPSKISLTYYDKDKSYTNLTIVTMLPQLQDTGATESSLNVETNIAVSRSKASELLEGYANKVWADMFSYGPFSVSRKYLFLEVGDVIEIVDRSNRVHLVQINKIKINTDFNMSIEAGVFAKSFIGTEPALDDSDPPPALTTPDNMYIRLLDIPNFNGERLTAPGFYYGGTAIGTWTGASAQVSLDNQTWSPMPSLGDNYHICGVAISALGPIPFPYEGETPVLDTTSKVQVRLYKGTISSVDAAGIAAGFNTAKLENEIIQFMTVTPLQNEGEYELSNIYRGLFGTQNEWFHLATDSFDMLTHNLKFYQISQQNVGKIHYFRFFPIGGEEYLTMQMPVYGYNAYPLSPIKPSAYQKQTDLAIYIRFQGRSRLTKTVYDNFSQFTPEASPVQYKCDILDPANPSTVLRSLLIENSWEFTYAKAQWEADFNGLLPQPLHVRISQISTTGAGNSFILDYELGIGWEEDPNIGVPGYEILADLTDGVYTDANVQTIRGTWDSFITSATGGTAGLWMTRGPNANKGGERGIRVDQPTRNWIPVTTGGAWYRPIVADMNAIAESDNCTTTIQTLTLNSVYNYINGGVGYHVVRSSDNDFGVKFAGSPTSGSTHTGSVFIMSSAPVGIRIGKWSSVWAETPIQLPGPLEGFTRIRVTDNFLGEELGIYVVGTTGNVELFFFCPQLEDGGISTVIVDPSRTRDLETVYWKVPDNYIGTSVVIERFDGSTYTIPVPADRRINLGDPNAPWINSYIKAIKRP